MIESTTLENVTYITSEVMHLDNVTYSWPFEPWNVTTPTNKTFTFALPVIPQWISWLYGALLCMSIFLGIPGNTLTAAAYANIKLKTNCDWYILFVALIDLVSCTFKNTSYLMEYLSVWASYTNSNYCKFTAWISQSMVCVSIFLFALIAIDRYMKLCHTASASITPAASRNVTLVLTLVNAALAAPCLVIFDNNSRGVCQVQESMKTSLITAYYSFLFTLFLIMMAIVIFCYVRIAIKVRQSRRVRPIPETSKSEAMTRSEDGGEDYFTNPNVPQQQSTKDGELREVEGRQNNIQLTVVAPRVRFQSPNRGVNVLPQIYPALNTEIHPALATSVEADHEENLDVLNQIQTRRKFLRQQRNLRVTSLLFVITAIFILSWMAPYAAMVKGLYVGFRYPLSLGDLVLVMYGPNIYVINTFSNPLVYAILSPSYRKLVRNVLRKVRVISWRVVQCN